MVKRILPESADNTIPLLIFGMVTSASFTDIDKDGWKICCDRGMDAGKDF